MLKKTFFITVILVVFTAILTVAGAVLKLNFPEYGEEIGYTIFLMVASCILSLLFTIAVLIHTICKKFLK